MMKKSQSSTQLFGSIFVTIAQFILRSLNIDHVGLTPIQFMICIIVYTHPNVTMSELAQALGISSAQLSRTMRVVEDRGLVKREHNKDNRRVVNVHRTKDGDQFVEAQIDLVKQSIGERFSTLTTEQSNELSEHLAASIGILEQAGIVQMSPEDFLATLPNLPLTPLPKVLDELTNDQE
ncbi:MarR family winged helix-turn-helix transcriptional regulator [Lapidilactobacillus bayanensis]|uniref:MarR family winged helix-turn-helix transcriptional regulator n=1 Tax=Lapidilactobacillus bayanensis TaxID=2485998 RepID=UPI000F7B43B7|nr:MarR family transcriptional regulator [Lapidilactobacillus bayanensis]